MRSRQQGVDGQKQERLKPARSEVEGLPQGTHLICAPRFPPQTLPQYKSLLATQPRRLKGEFTSDGRARSGKEMAIFSRLKLTYPS